MIVGLSTTSRLLKTTIKHLPNLSLYSNTSVHIQSWSSRKSKSVKSPDDRGYSFVLCSSSSVLREVLPIVPLEVLSSVLHFHLSIPPMTQFQFPFNHLFVTLSPFHHFQLSQLCINWIEIERQNVGIAIRFICLTLVTLFSYQSKRMVSKFCVCNTATS
jgi:hypothetical protein